ncbi:MAG: hypothetical protein ABI867_08375 [Kofleriaceae bacterium]
MSKIVFVSALLFSALGCGSKADNALNELEGFKNKMCECKDKVCADKVNDEMLEWSKKMKDEGVKKSELTDDQKTKAKDINKEMSKCRGDLK